MPGCALGVGELPYEQWQRQPCELFLTHASYLCSSRWSFFYYIIVGVSTALETLGAQAAGARDRSRLVVWGLSAFICMSLFGLPIAVSV